MGVLASVVLTVDLTAERMQGDFFGFVDLFKYREAEPDEKFLSGWIAIDGSNNLVRAEAPLPTRSDNAPEVALGDALHLRYGWTIAERALAYNFQHHLPSRPDVAA